ncbi:MAG: hypothetical protein DWQ41_12335 [Planctomycetota bacterium]|nr:MAG: hypothetical protein DWQ41_12335 [Planctomycetota bacterium]
MLTIRITSRSLICPLSADDQFRVINSTIVCCGISNLIGLSDKRCPENQGRMKRLERCDAAGSLRR